MGYGHDGMVGDCKLLTAGEYSFVKEGDIEMYKLEVWFPGGFNPHGENSETPDEILFFETEEGLDDCPRMHQDVVARVTEVKY